MTPVEKSDRWDRWLNDAEYHARVSIVLRWMERSQGAATDELLSYAMDTLDDLDVLPLGQKITHGRHCTCTACKDFDWTFSALACGMHVTGCPARYQPLGPAGSYVGPGQSDA